MSPALGRALVALVGAAACGAALYLTTGTRASRAAVVAPPQPVRMEQVPPAEPEEREELPPPEVAPASAEEVQPVLDRAFEGTLLAARERDAFASGDWNGDGSSDLLAVAAPRPDALAALNHGLANWLIQDAAWKGHPPDLPQTPRIAEGDVLVAVVHGHAAEGFRNPDARQGYLLLHAVGRRMRALPLARAFTMLGVGHGISLRPGDALLQAIDGRRSLLIWNGWRYARFDLPPGERTRVALGRR